MVLVEIDRLNSLVRGGAILGAVHFNILADNPSGPLTFVVSRAAKKLHTPPVLCRGILQDKLRSNLLE